MQWRYGALDILQSLANGGLDLAADTCAAAARGGHLDVLEYLWASGCDWDARTCAYAAKGGHLLRAELSETAPLGRMRGWNAARPILQWSVTR